jgi:hypothetical protein
MIKQPFNVNDHVWVKLTPTGVEHIRRIGQGFRFSSLEEKGGWSRWQMWDLMSLFGPIIAMDCQMPFETTIELEMTS